MFLFKKKKKGQYFTETLWESLEWIEKLHSQFFKKELQRVSVASIGYFQKQKFHNDGYNFKSPVTGNSYFLNSC